MSDTIIAETTTITGHGGDEIEAYFARPLDGNDQPSVVVLHHMPGYDRATKEIVRTFAVYGYAALMPEPAPPVRARARRQPTRPRPRGSRRRARRPVHRRRRRARSTSCAAAGIERQGRRDRLLLGRPAGVPGRVHASTSTPRSTATADGPTSISAPDLRCPLLGLFGDEDQSPSPDDVAAMAKALEANGKTFEFHSYEDAGHAFFSVDRPSYRLEAAKDGWKRIWAFFGTHLKGT